MPYADLLKSGSTIVLPELEMPVPACSTGQKMPDSWAALGTTLTDGLYIRFRPLFESARANTPLIGRYTLLITELETEIVVLALHFFLFCAVSLHFSAIDSRTLCVYTNGR